MEVNNSISNLYQLRKWVTPRVEIGEWTGESVQWGVSGESEQSVDSVETRQSVGSTHNVATVTA